MAAGVDYVETDVQRTADGALVLLHDDDLDRTTNGRGTIAQASEAEALALDAGSWFAPEFAGQRLMRVDAFLDWTYERRPLGAEIDIKTTGGQAAEVLDQLLSESPDCDPMRLTLTP